MAASVSAVLPSLAAGSRTSSADTKLLLRPRTVRGYLGTAASGGSCGARLT